MGITGRIQKTYQMDLVMTYTLAFIVMLFNLFSLGPSILWKIIFVAILSLDIGGGVVSNFTRGTISYYSESKLSPHAFIWFHSLQSIVLTCVYWDFSVQIAIASFMMMTFSSIVINLYQTSFQRQMSIFLFAVLVMAISYSGLPLPSFILLLFMGFKMVVGFAGHWKYRC
jgi:hypothetical protein